MIARTLADQYTAQDCTLDGQPAIISGRLCDCAYICLLGSMGRVAFSWYTVDRIMQAGGHFKS